MSIDLRIDFRFQGQTCHVDLQRSSGSRNAIVIGGIAYSLQGKREALDFIQNCIAKVPKDSLANLTLAGNELKARMWQAGAKEIQISSAQETHKIGLQILGRPLNIQQTIEELCDCFEKHYVFPDTSRRCSQYLRRQLREGAYEGISDPETFAQAVTADLRRISEDKHIVFELMQAEATAVQQQPEQKELREERYPKPQLAHSFEYKPSSNIGWMGAPLTIFPYELRSGYLQKDQRIGYLDFCLFSVCEPKEQERGNVDLQRDIAARKVAILHAVANLKNAETIILDLRNNGGGQPQAVQYLCSLFLPENIPLNRIVWRKGDAYETEDFNTLSYAQVPQENRLLSQKLIVLIGPHTFSAAEEFANNMKILQRGTVVGEPSGGGANPGGCYDIGKDFTFVIPEGYATNPLEQGNWEGVGIIPDHVIPAKEALEQAIILSQK